MYPCFRLTSSMFTGLRNQQIATLYRSIWSRSVVQWSQNDHCLEFDHGNTMLTWWYSMEMDKKNRHGNSVLGIPILNRVNTYHIISLYISLQCIIYISIDLMGMANFTVSCCLSAPRVGQHLNLFSSLFSKKRRTVVVSTKI